MKENASRDKLKLARGKLSGLYAQQFVTLLKKDLITTVQGKLFFYLIRILVPSICCLIIFILDRTRDISDYNGVPPTHRVLDLKMPHCFLLAGKNETGGYGSKINPPNCTTIAYYPQTNFTNQIMARVAQTLGLEFDKDVRGTNVKSNALNGTQLGGLYAVLFDYATENNSFQDNMRTLRYRVYYNQTYIDNPNFYSMYGEGKFGAALKMQFMMLDLVSTSSFPMILHGHVLSSIMHANGIVYDPIVRQNPFISQEGQPVNPMIVISAPLTGMLLIFHFLFTYIALNQDKTQGILDALRLGGVADFVYIAENFVFQFAIFLLSLVGQMWALYGFPVKYDFFQFIDWNLMLSLLIVGGIYATALAIFINFVASSKIGITLSIIFVALFLAALLIFLMLGDGFLYDPSVIPWAILRGVIAVFYPFALVANVFLGLFLENDTRVDVNMDTLEYKVITQKEFHASDFLRSHTVDCSLKSCSYHMPSFLVLEILILVEAIALIFLAWVLGEWIPANSSACRPPWKLFRSSYFDVKDQGFTLGATDTRYSRNFKKKIEGRATRKPLSLENARKCLAETTQKSDPDMVNGQLGILTGDMSGNEILIAHHLHKTFRRSMLHKQSLLQGAYHHALKSFSLVVSSGEVLGIGGHNGSGKTTSQNLLTGAIKMDRPGFRIFANTKETKQLINNAWICGYSIREDMHQVRRQLGICPQFNTNVYQDLTVYQNMEFTCRIQNIPFYDHDRIIRKMLAKIGLSAWADKKLSQLSGGMARRVCVAISLLNPTRKLSLIDEGTTGLDPSTKRIIWSLIKDTVRTPRKSGIVVGPNYQSIKLHRVREKLPAIIMTSHDMDELNTICDTIAIMSAGQIVAQGTALDLKRKYGGGYSLSVVSYSAESLTEFVSNLTAHVKSIGDEEKVKVIDQSGSAATISIKEDAHLTAIITYLDEAKYNGELLQDFCLERTSMDEVFVTIGQTFEMANGGEQFEDLHSQKPKAETVAEDSIEQMSQISMASENSVDVELNGNMKSMQQLTQQQIQEILSPKKGKPQALRAILYKMAHNDMLSTTGIIAFVAFPIVLLLLAYLMADQLIPWFVGKVNSVLTKYMQNMDSLCQLCELMRAYDLPVPECNGYDAWGFQNTCQMVQVQKGTTYSYTPVWYGGDMRCYILPALYATQEGSGRFIIFDKDERLGKHNMYLDPVIARKQSGVKVVVNKNVTVNKTSIPISSQSYKYFSGSGSLASSSLRKPTLDSIDRYMNGVSNESFIFNLPIKPIAVQDITRKNEKLNTFTLYSDWHVENGYELFDGSKELDDYYLKLMRSSRLPYDGYLVEPNYRDRIPEAQLNVEKYYKRNPEEMRHDPIYIAMDDAVNLQHVRQQVASILPIGFMDMDHPEAVALYEKLKAEGNASAKIYTPVFSGFSPPRMTYPYYAGARAKVAWVPTERYDTFVSQLKNLTGIDDTTVDNILTPITSLSLQPTREPSVIASFFLESGTVMPHTSLIDMMMRSADSLLKTEVNDSFNVYGSVQMFSGKLVNVMDAAAGASQIVMTTLFLALATFFGMIKFGSHLVLDRQTGMRKQLYLNGVRFWDYWGASLLYSFLMSVLIQVIVLFFGVVVFQIKVLVKIDAAVLLLICLGAVVGSVGMSSFFSVFFNKQSMYIVAVVAVLVAAMLITMFSSDGIPTTAPWYAYLLPATTYVLLLVYCSFYGFTFTQLRGTSFGFLFAWIFIESAILLAIAIYLDRVLPLNGYKPEPWYYPFKRLYKAMRKEKSDHTTKKDQLDVMIPPGLGIQEPTETPITECRGFNSSVCLQDYDQSISVKTQRDEAALHDESRMDLDVAQERKQIKYGIPANTPVVISNLQKQFGKFLAVRDVSFHIPPNSVFALLGANGAGKTTALQMIVGLLQPTAGKIILNGYDMSEEDNQQQVYKYLGLCPQFDVYLPNLTVRQHLKIFAAVHGVPWKNADKVVEDLARFVHLGEVLDKNVCTLSGGQRRRQSLALAIIG